MIFDVTCHILDKPTCSNCSHFTTDSNCEPLCKKMNTDEKMHSLPYVKQSTFAACNLWQQDQSRKNLINELPFTYRGNLDISIGEKFFDFEGAELISIKEEFIECEEVIIPYGITKICSDAFNMCTKLKRLFIPESVTQIESSAFSDCSSLKEIHLPDSIEQIGYGAFHHCTRLEKINIPANLSQIEGLVFSDCFALKTVLFPKESKLETIKKEAFMNCNKLEKVRFPASLKQVEKWAFRWCDPLPEGTLVFPQACSVAEDIFDPE
ncbi:MAG: leucine-rich repeat domain-containing protein [Treponemataceae bacterium]|nr:leucine-rich repeat domain-containing protein [Treponemataceae bacterium]